MDSSDFNKERRRKTSSRAKWAKALMQPRTLKVLIGFGKTATFVVRLIFELNDILRK